MNINLLDKVVKFKLRKANLLVVYCKSQKFLFSLGLLQIGNVDLFLKNTRVTLDSTEIKSLCLIQGINNIIFYLCSKMQLIWCSIYCK